MPAWLIELTRPEDRLLWAWLAIVVGYALVALMTGRHALRRPPPDRRESAS